MTAVDRTDQTPPAIPGALDEEVPLLLHSLTHLREYWLPLLEAADVRTITEIGSETGVTTELLADWLADHGGGALTTVDPQPAEPLVALEEAGRVQLVRALSPDALAGLPVTDAYLIDGDHNYSVVSRELATIAEGVGEDDPFPLLVFHDVGWPSGRRDQYYDPDVVPDDQVHPHTWDRGVRPGRPGVGQGGFRGEGDFAWALEEGGPRNGVLTAVEDFVAARSDLKLATIPSVFGVGVVYPAKAPYSRKLTALLSTFDRHPLLARLERNRVDLFVRVLDLQDESRALSDELVDLRRATGRIEAAAATRAARAEARELQLRAEAVELSEQLDAARAEIARLTGEATVRDTPRPGWLRTRLGVLRTVLNRLAARLG